MKKLLLVLAVAGFAVACNNKSENKEGEKKDTTATQTPAMDTTKKADTTAKMAPADSTKK